LNNIIWRNVSNSEYEDLWKRFPTLRAKADLCPTCEDKFFYLFEGEEHECDCEVQRGLRRHYLYANIGIRYHSLSFDDLYEEKDDLRIFLEDYIENFEHNARYGRGVTFNGPLGTGKTFAQILIMKELIKKGYKGWFDSFTNIVSQFSSVSSKDYLMNMVRSAEIFSLDEVIEPMSIKQHEYFSEVYESVIRYRVENNLPTVIGTNLTSEKHEELYPRVWSLLNMVQIPVFISGNDVRASQAKDIVDLLITNKETRPIR
jgi:DNA replication protein DnaC